MTPVPKLLRVASQVVRLIYEQNTVKRPLNHRIRFDGRLAEKATHQISSVAFHHLGRLQCAKAEECST